MPKMIVDFFEVVHIDDHQANGIPRGFCPFDLQFQEFLKVGLVMQTGQAVINRRIDGPFEIVVGAGRGSSFF